VRPSAGNSRSSASTSAAPAPASPGVGPPPIVAGARTDRARQRVSRRRRRQPRFRRNVRSRPDFGFFRVSGTGGFRERPRPRLAASLRRAPPRRASAPVLAPWRPGTARPSRL
jgi:hypothetical protein